MSVDEEWLIELRSHLAALVKSSNVMPPINAINELANAHLVDAKLIVNEICAAIARESRPDKRLQFFYLFDTLSKNRRFQSMFRPLIASVIELPFVKTYQYMCSEKRQLMDKTLRAWKANEIFDANLLDSIRAQCDNPSLIKSNSNTNKSSSNITKPSSNMSKPSVKSDSNDPRRRAPTAPEQHDAKRVKREDSRASSFSLSPEIEQTLLALSSSLQPYPHLMPMFHKVRAALSVSDGDMNVVGPQIRALTIALEEAVNASQRMQQPTTYAPTPVMQQPINYPPPPMHQPMFHQNYPPPQYGYPPMHYAPQSYADYSLAPPQHQPPIMHHVHAPPAPISYSEPPRQSPLPIKPKTFDAEDLKTRDPSVIAALYDEAGDQCQTCGFRCKTAVAMSAHLDYHFKLNRREAKRDKLRQSHALHRDWYWTVDEWTAADDVIFGKLSLARTDEESDSDDDEAEADDVQSRSVIADDSQTQCHVCLQTFETFWNEEEEAWMYRGTITVNDDINQDRLFSNNDDANIDNRRATLIETFNGQILHVNCALSLVTEEKPNTNVQIDNANLPSLERDTATNG